MLLIKRKGAQDGIQESVWKFDILQIKNDSTKNQSTKINREYNYVQNEWMLFLLLREI